MPRVFSIEIQPTEMIVLVRSPEAPNHLDEYRYRTASYRGGSRRLFSMPGVVGPRPAQPVMINPNLEESLFDLAEVLSPQALERAFNQAEVLRLFDLRALGDVIHRNPGRHAHRPLRTLLSTLTDEPRITRSELERLFLDLVRKAGLPPPTTNARVAGHEVDAYWPAQRLVVELDGFAYHRTRRAFERDRERTEALQLAGLTVQPFTHRRISADPDGVAETVRRLLRL